jgi:hypothetical protein
MGHEKRRVYQRGNGKMAEIDGKKHGITGAGIAPEINVSGRRIKSHDNG